ncbi:MAG TPA: hypothetical protein VHC22_31750 [Pirellulales bacterium]|nr:hypothetical protein [Pirellulales bacterium]
MISIGLTVVATLHLLAVYVAMTGPLVCLWLQRRAARDELAARLDRYLLWLAVAALPIAAALGGVAILLISQLFPDAYLAAVRVLPKSRYWPYGAIELVFSLLCFLAAALLPAVSRWRGVVRWLATLFGSTNLVYHFPALFVMLGVLSTRRTAWGQSIKFTVLLGDAEIGARIVHHLLAALAVGGVAIAWYGLRRSADAARADVARADTARSIAWGSRIATAAVLGQVFTGLWLIVVIPEGSRNALSGGDGLAAASLGGALLLTFFVLPRLAAAAWGQVEHHAMYRTVLLVLAIVALMTATRHRTRSLLLSSISTAQRQVFEQPTEPYRAAKTGLSGPILCARRSAFSGSVSRS